MSDVKHLQESFFNRINVFINKLGENQFVTARIEQTRPANGVYYDREPSKDKDLHEVEEHLVIYTMDKNGVVIPWYMREPVQGEYKALYDGAEIGVGISTDQLREFKKLVKGMHELTADVPAPGYKPVKGDTLALMYNHSKSYHSKNNLIPNMQAAMLGYLQREYISNVTLNKYDLVFTCTVNEIHQNLYKYDFKLIDRISESQIKRGITAPVFAEASYLWSCQDGETEFDDVALCDGMGNIYNTSITLMDNRVPNETRNNRENV